MVGFWSDAVFLFEETDEMADIVQPCFLGCFRYGASGSEVDAGGFQFQVGEETGGCGMGIFFEKSGKVAFG